MPMFNKERECVFVCPGMHPFTCVQVVDTVHTSFTVWMVSKHVHRLDVCTGVGTRERTTNPLSIGGVKASKWALRIYNMCVVAGKHKIQQAHE